MRLLQDEYRGVGCKLVEQNIEETEFEVKTNKFTNSTCFPYRYAFVGSKYHLEPFVL